MIENFWFSLNVSLPIFLLLAAGFGIKRLHLLDDSFFSQASSLVFTVALPAKLFYDTATSDFSRFNPAFILVCMLGTTAFFLIAWGVGALMLREAPEKVGAFAHGAFRGNYVYIGFALMQNILGTDVIPLSATLASAFVLPLYNVYAVILLTVTGSHGRRIRPGVILRQIATNPMILGIVAGLPFALLHVRLPFALTQSLDYLGALCTPLALLVIGASIRFSDIAHDIRPILGACGIKLVLQPLIMVAIGLLLGLTHEELLVLFVLFGVPAAANVYIVTRKMGGDAQLASGIIVVSVLLSMFTLTAGVFLLRTAGIV